MHLVFVLSISFPYRDSSFKNLNSVIIYSPHVIPNLYDFFFLLWKIKNIYFQELWIPLTCTVLIIVFCFFSRFHSKKVSHTGLETHEGE